MGLVDFNQIYAMYTKRLLYIAYRYTKDQFLAEDIVQETFIKAHKNIHTIKDTRKLGSWLAVIATRTAIDYLRSNKRNCCLSVDPAVMEPFLGSSENGMNIEEEVAIRLYQEELFHIIGDLSKEFQEVLILKVHYGLKDNEIAALLNLKVATVKTRLYRARKQLKQAYVQKETA
jgi:RNA polymerase sigma-70 factor (ECF subfamily)